MRRTEAGAAGVVENRFERGESLRGEVAELVAQGGGVFNLGLVDGGGKGRVVLAPLVNCGPADTGGLGGLGERGSRGKGECDLSLNGAEAGTYAKFHLNFSVAVEVKG